MKRRFIINQINSMDVGNHNDFVTVASFCSPADDADAWKRSRMRSVLGSIGYGHT
jgi:hypothetical protein